MKMGILAHLHRGWRLLDRKARLQLGLLGLMTSGAGMLEAFGVGMVFPFIKVISEPTWLADVPWLSRWAPILGLDLNNHNRTVLILGIGLIGLFLIKNLYLIIFYIVQFTIAYGNTARYSALLLERYMTSSYLMHLRRNSAELITNTRELPRCLFNCLLAVISFSTETVVLLLVCGVLVIAQPQATLIAAALLITLTSIFYAVTGRLFTAWGAEETLSNSRSQRALQQCLGSIKDARVLGCESYFIDHYAREAHHIMAVRRSMQVVSQAPRLSVELSMMIGMIVVVMVMASHESMKNDMLPQLAVFAAAAFRLMPSINRMTLAVSDMKSTMMQLILLEKDMAEGPGLSNSKYKSASRVPMRAQLQISGVSFTYPGATRAAIDEIDLDIHKGETIGVVGGSGAGKSTLIDILLGLLHPDKGKFLVDGREMLATEGWYGAVGYVPQNIFITDDTVRRNVAFGVADDQIDDKAVIHALEQAHLWNFVSGLRQGLDTLLDENGVRLSGGQRQRIGIARALYRDPDLLVFDEATSALDPLTERDITEAIRSLHGHKTVIIIAHRLSTVRHCDRILMLDHGRIAQSGRFDELAERSPAFRALMEALEMALHPQNEGNTEQS